MNCKGKDWLDPRIAMFPWGAASPDKEKYSDMRTSAMKTSYRIIIIFLVCAFVGCIYLYKGSHAASYAETSSPAGPSIKMRLIDYGSKSCKCQPKLPIYEALEVKYADSVFFEYVDLFTATKNGVRNIPSQVIYDADFNEITRHEGFDTEEAIEDLVETAKQALNSHP
jgi:hypothetical protein